MFLYLFDCSQDILNTVAAVLGYEVQGVVRRQLVYCHYGSDIHRGHTLSSHAFAVGFIGSGLCKGLNTG